GDDPDGAGDEVGPVGRWQDARRQLVLDRPRLAQRRGERSRGAAPDLPGDRRRAGGARVDPRVAPAREHGGQLVGAEPEVRAERPVVVDRDAVALVVAGTPCDRAAIGGLVSVEADPRMRAVAERLVRGAAAAAEEEALSAGEHAAAGSHELDAFAGVRPALGDPDLGHHGQSSRIALRTAAFTRTT